MPRRSSGGRSASRPAARAPRSSPPPATQARPAAPAQGSARGGIGAAVVDGIGWGVGTSVAHRAIDGIMGPRVIQHETVESSPAAASAPSANTIEGSNACSAQSKAFQECLTNYGSDISKCQFYMDMLAECKRSPGPVLGA